MNNDNLFWVMINVIVGIVTIVVVVVVAIATERINIVDSDTLTYCIQATNSPSDCRIAVYGTR